MGKRAYSNLLKRKADTFKGQLNTAKQTFEKFREVIRNARTPQDIKVLFTMEEFYNMKNNWMVVIVQIALQWPSEFPNSGFSSGVMKASKYITDKWWGPEMEYKGSVFRNPFYTNIFGRGLDSLNIARELVLPEGKKRIEEMKKDFDGFCELVEGSCNEVLEAPSA